MGAAVGVTLVVLHVLAHAPQLGGPLGRSGVTTAVALVPLDQVLGRVDQLVFSPADLSGIDGQLNGDPIEPTLALVAQDAVDDPKVSLQHLGGRRLGLAWLPVGHLLNGSCVRQREFTTEPWPDGSRACGHGSQLDVGLLGHPSQLVSRDGHLVEAILSLVVDGAQHATALSGVDAEVQVSDGELEGHLLVDRWQADHWLVRLLHEALWRHQQVKALLARAVDFNVVLGKSSGYQLAIQFVSRFD